MLHFKFNNKFSPPVRKMVIWKDLTIHLAKIIPKWPTVTFEPLVHNKGHPDEHTGVDQEKLMELTHWLSAESWVCLVYMYIVPWRKIVRYVDCWWRAPLNILMLSCMTSLIPQTLIHFHIILTFIYLQITS